MGLSFLSSLMFDFIISIDVCALDLLFFSAKSFYNFYVNWFSETRLSDKFIYQTIYGSLFVHEKFNQALNYLMVFSSAIDYKNQILQLKSPTK